MGKKQNKRKKIKVGEFIEKCASVICAFFRRVWKLLPHIINVNTISLLVAAIAAYISYRALDESRVQRETMYRPELYVGETMLYADLTDTAGIKYYKIENDTIVRNEADVWPWMKIINVGMGSALHLQGAVNLRFEVMSKAMMAMKMKKKANDIYDTYVHGDDTLKLAGAGGIQWHEDYILPLYQTQDDCTKVLPKNDIDNMVKAALWLNDILHSRFQGYIIPVKLKYKDINEKWYVKETWMQMQCYTDEDKKGMRLRICSGIFQKEFMDEDEKWLNGELEDGRSPGAI